MQPLRCYHHVLVCTVLVRHARADPCNVSNNRSRGFALPLAQYVNEQHRLLQARGPMTHSNLISRLTPPFRYTAITLTDLLAIWQSARVPIHASNGCLEVSRPVTTQCTSLPAYLSCLITSHSQAISPGLKSTSSIDPPLHQSTLPITASSISRTTRTLLQSWQPKGKRRVNTNFPLYYDVSPK